MTPVRAVAVLGLLVWALYANSLRGGFVVDNHLVLLEDPRIQSVSSGNVRAIFTQDYLSPNLVGGVYRPLTTLSYLFNHAVLGNRDRPAGYHVVNVLLHWANTVLVYAVVRKLHGDAAVAWWSAALFASHPIATEAVTNMVGRADLLAAFFVLAALVLHVRTAEHSGWRRARGLAGLALTTTAGILSKENAVTVVAVVCLYDVLYRRPRTVGAVLPTYLAMGLPLLAVWYARSALYAGVRPATILTADNPLVAADFWTACMTALQVIARYGWLLVWPARLSCDYSYDQIPLVTWRFDAWQHGTVLVAVAAIVGMIVIAVRHRRTHCALAFFIGFSLATFLPTSNLVFLIGSILAERFLYLPSVGFAACVAILAFAISRRSPARRPRLLAAGVLALFVLACSVRTVVRNRDWHDEVQLWSAAAAVSPRSFKTHHGLAFELYRIDEPGHPRIDTVIAESETALRILEAKPLPPGHEPSAVPMNLGIYYWTKANAVREQRGDGRGWDQKAMAALERAVQLDQAENDMNRRLEVLRGKAPDTVPDVGIWKIYHYLGVVASQLERYPQAIEAFAYLRHLWPSYSAVYQDIARVQRASGRLEDAAVTALEALLLDPNDRVAPDLLVEVYGQIDAEGCTLIGTAGGRRLNPACPRVRADVCSAYAGLAEVFREAKQDGSAEEFTRRAARDQCS